MENFEPLNAIVDEFQVKKSTLAIFGLDQLYERGTYLRFGEFEPVSSRYLPIITHDDEEPEFCSIFSEPDSLYTTQPTQLTQQPIQLDQLTAMGQGAQPTVKDLTKLVSDREILSSEFEEQSTPLLLSEVNA